MRLHFSKSLSPHRNLGRLSGSPQSCDYFNYQAGICCSCQNDGAMGEGQELAGVGAKSVSLWKLRQTSLFLVRVRWPRSFPVLADPEQMEKGRVCFPWHCTAHSTSCFSSMTKEPLPQQVQAYWQVSLLPRP